MKCYAIAVKLGDQKMDWVSAHSPLFTGLFFKSMEKQYKTEVDNTLRDMGNNQQHVAQKEGYFLHAQKYEDDYCIIVTDEELSRTQLAYLAIYLLEEKMDKSLVIEDIQQYCCHRKIRQIQEELEKTKTIMVDNIETLLARGERIEALASKAEDLAKGAVRFKHETEKLNSCWPSCTLF